jgi:DDE superfamily endonuclease
VSGAGHTLVAMRRYLPTAGTTDKARLDKAGVPTAHRGYRARHQWALDRLPTSGLRLPPGWSAGDDEMGRPYWLRRRLDGRGERSMLAVPGNTLIRDLETAPLASSGRGRPPTPPWQRGEAWRAALAEGAWKRIDVRDGSQGPLVVDVVTRRVVARTPRRHHGDEEL